MSNEMVKTEGLQFGQLAQGMTGNAVVDIFLCPERFEMMQRGATLLANSKIVPPHFAGNVGGCFIAMQIAYNLGIDPFSLMQKTYVISGKLGIEAQIAIAVANQRKIFAEPLEYTFEEDPKNAARPLSCTCKGILSANNKTVTETLTWVEVAAEGWDKKGGSKWMTIPRRMYKYRTSLWLIRTYAPEVLLGMQSIDELEDSSVINITPEKTPVSSALMGGGDLVLEPAEKAEVTKVEPLPAKEEPKEPVKKPALNYYGCCSCWKISAVPGKMVSCKCGGKDLIAGISSEAVAEDLKIAADNAAKASADKIAAAEAKAKAKKSETKAKDEPKATAKAEEPPTEEKAQPALQEEVDPMETATAEFLKSLTGPSYEFGKEYNPQNCKVVLKNLCAKAEINEPTFKIMAKTFTDGLDDMEEWTQDNFIEVRGMLIQTMVRKFQSAWKRAKK